mgnify:CR=1 FL=1
MDKSGSFRVYMAITTKMAEDARLIHETSPLATHLLGRALTGTGLMGLMLREPGFKVTLQFKGDGPAQQVLCTASSDGAVKGYIVNPNVDLPVRSDGSPDVGGALGIGTITCIRDTGMKEPYVGRIDLVSGEIAEDLTYYYATSEQVPSSVALGVLMNKDNTVCQAGGFIIQLMPGASDDCIDRLEARLGEMSSITALLDAGKTPEEILEDLLGDMGLEILDRLPARFHCDCHKSRVARAITSIGKKELQSMIDEGKPIEVSCHFCNKIYTFTVDELKEMLEKATRP